MFPSEPQAMVDLQVLQPNSSDLQPAAVSSSSTDHRLRRNHGKESSALQDLLYDTKLKLEQFSANTSAKMDPNSGHQGGNRSGHSGQYGYDQKGQGGDPGVLDGILPRIETRGQSRGGRSKYDDKSKRGSKR